MSNRSRESIEDIENMAVCDRIEFLKGLDSIFSEKNSEESPLVVKYYQKMVDKAIAEIESTEVRNGIAVWKLYSSSFIIKTAHCIFALDFCEGPNKNQQSHTNAAFSLTTRQRGKIAGLVDYSFHSHHHHDHMSLEMVEAMVERNKKVFVTNDTLSLWADKPFRKYLKVAKEGFHQLEHLDVHVHYGKQHMEDNQEDECYAYVIMPGNDIRILLKGDMYDGNEFSSYLKKLEEEKLSIDIFMSSAWTGSGKDIIDEIEKKFKPFFIPSHEWEFTHRKPGVSGTATQAYIELYKRFKKHINAGRAAILTWGEHYYFIKNKTS